MTSADGVWLKCDLLGCLSPQRAEKQQFNVSDVFSDLLFDDVIRVV